MNTDRPSFFGTHGRSLTAIVGIYLATRLVVWTAAYGGSFYHFRIESGLTEPMMKQARVLREMPPERRDAVMKSLAAHLHNLEPLLLWDGRCYRTIVELGYHPDPPPADGSRRPVQRLIAFFPLHPLVCAALSRVVAVPVAMIASVHFWCLLACFLTYFWIARRFDQGVAVRTVAFLLCWPTACFYSFGYSEALTLLLLVAVFQLADRNAFGPAALLSGLASATRPTAAAIPAVLMLTYVLRSTLPLTPRLLRLAAIAAVGTSGLAAYAGYLTYHYGTPLVYFQNFKEGWVGDELRSDWFQYLTLARVWDQFKYFGRAVREFPMGLLNLLSPQTWNMPCNFAILALSLLGWRRVEPAFRPFLLVGPLIFAQSYLASGGATWGVEPIARYTAVSVPAFVVLAVLTARRPAALTTVLIAMLILLQAAWAFAFGAAEWAG